MLTLLKILFLYTLSIMGRVKPSLHWPAAWLAHYLSGSGKALNVPAHLIEGALPAIRQAMMLKGPKGFDIPWGSHCLNHSTLYEGRGFYGRPTLFYLVGGFSFTLTSTSEGVELHGEDVYDWHPTSDGEWFTSPLGSSKWMLAIVKVCGLIWGQDRFVTSGFPSGDAGISNKLWADFVEVGAKEFTSHMSHKWTWQEWRDWSPTPEEWWEWNDGWY